MPKKKHSSSSSSSRKQQPLSSFETTLQEIRLLQDRIAKESPPRGSLPTASPQQIAFASFPLSQSTLRGLDDAGYVELTPIQHLCLPHALAGRDLLAAAPTGSGKTLAFLIPLLESLFRAQHSGAVGALVLSPTRELALQTFRVLRKIGAYHALTAGLLVGGKREFRMEQRHVGRTNIVIATPGRLLQHLEQTADLDVSFLQVLVLDEADRILDMGFREQMTRILEYLPSGERQTMLFSATQTKRVSDLAALSLSKPEYLGISNDKSKTTTTSNNNNNTPGTTTAKTRYKTPSSLQQSLIIVPLEHKLNAVYSFLKSHLHNKTIVFLASCSQVRHAWELFCALQPGLPVMALHGKLVQAKRNQIFADFGKRPRAVLFATDVASRGLDVPNVDWVVQMDAPEDAAMYVHRAGRTARYKANGKAVLMLTPEEEKGGFGRLLEEHGLPIRKWSINPTKTVLVTQKAAALVAQRPPLHELAKKAFASYVRSIHLMPNKEVFSTETLPLDAYAASLGLASTPKIRFLKDVKDREELRKKKNVNHKLHRLKEQIKAEKLAKKIAKLGKTAPPQATQEKEPKTDEEDDDMLVVKRKHDFGGDDDDNNDDELPNTANVHQVTKFRNSKKIRIDGGTGQNIRIKFDDDGEVEEPSIMKSASKNKAVERDTLETSHDDYMQKVKARLATTSGVDRAEAKDRIREKHRKKRSQERGEREGDGNDNDEQFVVTLGNDNDSIDAPGSEDGADAESDDESASNTMDIAAQEELALAMIRGD